MRAPALAAVLALASLRQQALGSVLCDVGDAVEAVYDGDASYRAATIASVDMTASPHPTFTVTWADSSPSFRTMEYSEARKDGVTCATLVDVGQSFSAVKGMAFTLQLIGSELTQDCRLLVVAAAGTCGTSTLDAASAGALVPFGEAVMSFFDVVISAAGTYKVCFWSGQAFAGRGVDDKESYATEVGPLVVADTTTSTTTTTTTAQMYSRRRGNTYASTVFRAQGSRGTAYWDLSANPAAWNPHFPDDNAGTCRTCSRYARGDIDGNLQKASPLRLAGRLALAPGASPSDLGTGCEAADLLVAPVAPPSLLMVLRGACAFQEKASNAAMRGYRGMLVVDFQVAHAPLPDMSPRPGVEDSAMSLPSWMMPSDEGEMLRALAADDPVVTVTVEDVARKRRLSSMMSDAHGRRTYAAK